MGAAAHIVVVDGRSELVADAIARVEQLEARWSRFRSTSELSAINAAAGAPVVVSPETLDVVDRALVARDMTRGWFDPTLLNSLLEFGYDRSYDDLDSLPTPLAPLAPLAPAARRPTRGPVLARARAASVGSDVVVDRVVGAVRVAPGVGLDLGGIGKGRAADLIASELSLGARGVLVNLGGDLRAAGAAPTPAGWVVAMDPVFGHSPGRVAFGAGAVATSSQLTRRWRRDGCAVHHLLDSHTGEPAVSDVAVCTVIAGEAERAEVIAKAALTAGSTLGAALIGDLDVAAQFVLMDGSIERFGGFDRFVLADSSARMAA